MSPKTPRPGAIPGFTICRESHCGKIFVTVTIQDGEPKEVFIRFGKAGGCGSAMAGGLAQLVSYALRSGMDAADAIKALSGIQCHLGAKTCLNEVAVAIKIVVKAVQTGRDINELLVEHDGL